MLCYHLFYSVKNSKNSYTETKVFMRKQDALEESLKLIQCSNVEIVSIREVDCRSIQLEVFKAPDNCEFEEPFFDMRGTLVIPPEELQNAKRINLNAKQ